MDWQSIKLTSKNKAKACVGDRVEFSDAFGNIRTGAIKAIWYPGTVIILPDGEQHTRSTDRYGIKKVL